MNYLASILRNVLSALYQSCGASLVIAVLVMSVSMQIKQKGAGFVIQSWVKEFRTSVQFRRGFILVFYVCLILFRTLFGRTIWGNPLDNVLGTWGLHSADGSIYTENIENFILFLPLLPLLYRVWEAKEDQRKKVLQELLLQSLWISFCASMFIECCQLFFKIGTFQITDLLFNSLGGVAGGVLYWGFERGRKKIIEHVKKIGGWDVEPWKGYAELDMGEGRYDSTSVDYPAIEKLVREAGKMLCQARPTGENIHKKEGLANFCTDFDMEIQRFLIKGLSEILPGAGFFGEEDTEGNHSVAADDGYVFYIDPIDGTTNFMFGYHFSCISVGLAHKGKMIAGFVYDPYVNEMFTGIRGKGSWLNGQVLNMKDLSLSEGIAAFGCARYNEDKVDVLFKTVQEFYMKSLCIRSGGSAALDLCRIASGSNAVYLEMKLQPYDYAAASVIVEEAGGVIGQVDGSSITLNQPCSILAGTKTAVEETKKIMES